MQNVSEFDIFDDIEKDNNFKVELDTMSVESDIKVSTDKTIYKTGENITISGLVGTLTEYAQSVTIVVIDPNGEVVDISQVMPEPDGSFSHVTSSNAITVVGQYEIRSQYGSLKIRSNFDFA